MTRIFVPAQADQALLQIRPRFVVQIDGQVFDPLGTLPTPRDAAFCSYCVLLIAFQYLDAIRVEEIGESIRPSVAAATDADDLPHAFGYRLGEYLIVVPGSRQQVIVERIGSQLVELLPAKPGRAPSRDDGEEVSDQQVGVAVFRKLVNGLNMSQARDIHRIAQIR